MITAQTRLVGVIGHPVGHSRSPAMQNAAFQALGLDYCYLAFDVAPGRVADALHGMRSLGITGLNVTIPHKTEAYLRVDRLTPGALEVKAVNTIQLQDGVLVGHNTDGEGFVRSLEDAGVSLEGRSVALIGAGGAARSVAAACLHRGAGDLRILSRRPEQGEELAGWLGSLEGGGSSNIQAAALDRGEGQVSTAEIVVQCTPVGMHPHEEDPLPVPAEWIQSGAVVYDLIYNPLETRFLKAAREAGARTMNGTEMLVYQGAVAFEIWTGISPPLDIMRRALLHALEGERDPTAA